MGGRRHKCTVAPRARRYFVALALLPFVVLGCSASPGAGAGTTQRAAGTVAGVVPTTDADPVLVAPAPDDFLNLYPTFDDSMHDHLVGTSGNLPVSGADPWFLLVTAAGLVLFGSIAVVASPRHSRGGPARRDVRHHPGQPGVPIVTG